MHPTTAQIKARPAARAYTAERLERMLATIALIFRRDDDSGFLTGSEIAELTKVEDHVRWLLGAMRGQ